MTDADEYFSLLYDELHRVAQRHLQNSRSEITLGASTLLHETYLSLSKSARASFSDQEHFLAYASRAMRGLLIDYVRARRAVKRGGEFEITQLNEQDVIDPSVAGDADALDRLSDGLDALALLAPTLAQLVDLHFFCGFPLIDIAKNRGVSERTVQRDWRKARMLLRQLSADGDRRLDGDSMNDGGSGDAFPM